MNKNDRVDIEKQANDIDAIADHLGTLSSDMQGRFDSMPESISMGDRGDRIQEQIQYLDDIALELQDLRDRLLALKDGE